MATSILAGAFIIARVCSIVQLGAILAVCENRMTEPTDGTARSVTASVLHPHMLKATVMNRLFVFVSPGQGTSGPKQ
jgi:hypothetical protein